MVFHAFCVYCSTSNRCDSVATEHSVISQRMWLPRPRSARCKISMVTSSPSETDWKALVSDRLRCIGAALKVAPFLEQNVANDIADSQGYWPCLALYSSPLHPPLRLGTPGPFTFLKSSLGQSYCLRQCSPTQSTANASRFSYSTQSSVQSPYTPDSSSSASPRRP